MSVKGINVIKSALQNAGKIAAESRPLPKRVSLPSSPPHDTVMITTKGTCTTYYSWTDPCPGP
jgi:hypothetical protein